MATSSFTADLTLTYKKAKSFFEILESNKPSNNEIRRDLVTETIIANDFCRIP
jgi:hypothetical protein